MKILDALRQLKRKFSHYEPLVTVVIFRDRLLHNLKVFQSVAPHVRVAPVLKSNAYGHGLVQVAQIVDKEDVPFVVVDSPYEAIQLRDAGIRSQILVLGYTTAENIVRSRLKNVAFTITSLEHLQSLVHLNSGKRIRLHLKIDTGMHRQGIAMPDISQALSILARHPELVVDGVCSHLADPVDHQEFTEKQISSWHEALKLITAALPTIKYKHLSASFGVMFAKVIDANVIRLGIGLYGFVPEKLKNLDVRPVLEMRTCLTSIRTIKPGDSVGYDCSFSADKPMRIATLPVGYFEGVDRRLSNKGVVTVGGTECRFVGRVSMNISSIDVTDVINPRINDSVLVISAQKGAKNSLAMIAADCNTIPYEILVHIPWQLRRVVV